MDANETNRIAQTNTNALTIFSFINTNRCPLAASFGNKGALPWKWELHQPEELLLEFPVMAHFTIPAHTAPSPSPLNTGAFPKLLQQEVDQSPSHKAVHVQTSNPKPVGNEGKLCLRRGTCSRKLNVTLVHAEGLSMIPPKDRDTVLAELRHSFYKSLHRESRQTFPSCCALWPSPLFQSKQPQKRIFSPLMAEQKFHCAFYTTSFKNETLGPAVRTLSAFSFLSDSHKSWCNLKAVSLWRSTQHISKWAENPSSCTRKLLLSFLSILNFKEKGQVGNTRYAKEQSLQVEQDLNLPS